MTVKLLDPNDGYKKEVIDTLESLLKRANEGEILSILYVCERPGGRVSWKSTTMKDRYQVLGFLDHMKFLTNQSLDDSSEPCSI